jgi:hypothetical protein
MKSTVLALGLERPPMLAGTRLRFLLASFPLVLTFTVLSFAQVQGVPPGQFQGVPTAPFLGVPSPSFDAHSYGRSDRASSVPGCCANFFLPSGFSPLVPVQSLAEGHRHHRHHRDESGVVADPVYIPYAVPYAVDPDGDAADNPESAGEEPAESVPGNRATSSGGPRRYAGQGTGQYPVRNPEFESRNDGQAYDYDDEPDSDSVHAVSVKPEEPVVAQPATVLVFKDGHRSDVGNYAIVGDTLFDFAEGRARKILLADLDLPATRKANDERGVEFTVPNQ